MTLAIAAEVGVPAATAPSLDAAARRFASAVAADLKARRGRGLVVAGEFASPDVHAVAHAINAALGNVGSTVTYSDPVEANPIDELASLRELVEDLRAGHVDTLLIIGANPVFTAPRDFDFANALQAARFTI